jgi:hypothetical protein
VRVDEPNSGAISAELESLGVDPVKERIATKVYLGGLANVAQGWVERKEAASNAEQLALAHQANTTAQRSNWIAIAALVVAPFSMIAASWRYSNANRTRVINDARAPLLNESASASVD